MTTKPINESLFKKMWHEGKPYNAIGRAVGMDRSSVPARAAKMGLPPRPGLVVYARGVPKREIDAAKIMELWVSGMSMDIMRRELQIGETTLRNRLADMVLPPRTVKRTRRKMVPTPKPEPKAAPVYHPGLSAAIKRAGSSVQRLGKVATSYRVPYRDVLQMAGVQG